MAKPRSNADACAYWADGILTNEAQPHLTVNSIKVEGDVVYSFGHHFPMGIIMRNASGRCTRVLLNSDYWAGPNGFANTGSDQSSCRMEASQRAHDAHWNVELQSVPLTCSGRKDVPCRPREGDPEPPRPDLEVPTYFFRTDPGPEPVKDPHGCIAGREEEYEYQTRVWSFDHYHKWPIELHPHPCDNTDFIGAANGRIVWGEELSDWSHYNKLGTRIPTDVTYKQCPHCAAFDTVHSNWSQKYHGRWGRRPSSRGYKLYAEMMETYGSEQEWRDARVRDWRRVQEGRKAYQDWYDRNHIPFTAVPWSRTNGVMVPNFDRDGFPFRKDQEAYYRSQREQARAERRRQREREEQEKIERQLERLRRRREAKPDFETSARIVVRELNNIKQRVVTS